MLASLFVVLPVFGLIGLGYLARGTRLLRESTGEGLSDFVFVLAVPCLLFRTLARADIPPTQPWGYWIAYFTGLAVVWVLAMLVDGRCFARKGPELVASGFTAAQGTPTLCSVGPIGGMAHTPDEFLEVESLVPAAQVLALAVMRAAAKVE